MKDGTDPQCPVCGTYEETIYNIISGCLQLAKTEYIHWHDKSAADLHWKICREHNIKKADKWYEHQPKIITENNEITIRCAHPGQQRDNSKKARYHYQLQDKKVMHPHRHSHTIWTQHLSQDNRKAVKVQRPANCNQQDAGNKNHSMPEIHWKYPWNNNIQESR